MGRHSRKGPAPAPAPAPGPASAPVHPAPQPAPQAPAAAYGERPAYEEYHPPYGEPLAYEAVPPYEAAPAYEQPAARDARPAYGNPTGHDGPSASRQTTAHDDPSGYESAVHDSPPVYGQPAAHDGPSAYEVPAAQDGPGAYGAAQAPEAAPRRDAHRASDDAPRREEPLPYGSAPMYGGPRGRRRAEAAAAHQGYAPPAAPGSGARLGGHPEQREPGGAWGSGSATGGVYGDWRGVPRAPRPAAAAVLDTDTPAFGTPAVGFPQVTVPVPGPVAAAPAASAPAPAPDLDPLTSTGARRRVPGPRESAAEAPADGPGAAKSGSGRRSKVRTYTGMAAAAVTTVIAVVVAGQVVTETDGKNAAPRAAGEHPDRALPGQSAASRSDGRATPQPPAAAAPAPEQSYEQKMALQLPIDEKLKGPGVFDTVPGVAAAPGKGKVVRYRVDVEQGLGLDPQLFAEAVHRTLNDDRSWGHGGTKTFERVPGGEADFVITLASPGTTGVWCAKSGLDTTIDNVSCDSASTERVMINAYRWAQGSPTYGPDQMFAYRQMLINHEVGHRLGNGHVNCQTPGALAPIMQQQTKSLDIGGIQCKPNPWVFPGN